jgi:hypothetical protein
MEMTVLWDVAPCSLVEICRRFKSAYCLHHQDTSKMSVDIYETTRRNITEDSHLQTSNKWKIFGAKEMHEIDEKQCA